MISAILQFPRQLANRVVSMRRKTLITAILICVCIYALSWLCWRVLGYLHYHAEHYFLLGLFSQIAAGLAVFAGIKSFARPGRRALLLAMIGVTLVGSFYVAGRPRLLHRIGQPKQMKIWSAFHYYLGAKYFPELGYRDLYREVLKADLEGGNRFSKVEKIRDMETYRSTDADTIRELPRNEHWTDERWEEFVEDVEYMGRIRARSFWREPMADRGYNASPTWSAFGTWITNRLDVSNVRHQTIMIALDPIMLLIAFGVSVWAFGWTRSLLVLLGVLLWYGTKGSMIGKIFQYDWFAASWAGIALLARKRFAWAGALFAYASCSRIFPTILFCGPALHFLRAWWKEKKLHPGLSKMALSAALVGVLGIAIGASAGRGWAGWSEFRDNISIHNKEHIWGARRVGLAHLMTMDIQSGLSDKWGDKRIKNLYKNNESTLTVLRIVLFGLCVWLMLRTSTANATLYGCILVYVLAISSRYYAALYALLLLASAATRTRSPPGGIEPLRSPSRLALDAGFFMILATVHFADDTVLNPVYAFLLGNFLLFLWFGGHFWVTFQEKHHDQIESEAESIQKRSNFSEERVQSV